MLVHLVEIMRVWCLKDIMVNPYSIPNFLSTFILIFFGFFVMKKNAKSPLNIAFLLICISCSIWLLFDALAYNFTDTKIIMFLLRITYCGVTFICVTTLYYTTIFLGCFKRINYFST